MRMVTEKYNHTVKGGIIFIKTPDLFSYDECLKFLDRGFKDLTYSIEGKSIYKLLKVNRSLTLLKLSCDAQRLKIELLNTENNKGTSAQISAYVHQWFDLERDLSPFYNMAATDPILSSIIDQYHGLRLIAINDLYEALSWAIIGQQINLTFAYKTKNRLIETYGEKYNYHYRSHYLFPEPAIIANCSIEDLKKLQFSTNKANYLIGLSKLFADGALTKEMLLNINDPEKIEEVLTNIKGIGKWTANYALMKCLRIPSAFPIQDVGLQNAIKYQLKTDHKPDLDDIRKLARGWENWEAYATLYLWRSLIS